MSAPHSGTFQSRCSGCDPCKLVLYLRHIFSLCLWYEASREGLPSVEYGAKGEEDVGAERALHEREAQTDRKVAQPVERRRRAHRLGRLEWEYAWVCGCLNNDHYN